MAAFARSGGLTASGTCVPFTISSRHVAAVEPGVVAGRSGTDPCRFSSAMEILTDLTAGPPG